MMRARAAGEYLAALAFVLSSHFLPWLGRGPRRVRHPTG